MHARGGVGAVAGAQCDPAEEEVPFEFFPLLDRRGAEFILRAGLAAALVLEMFQIGVVQGNIPLASACCPTQVS